MKTKLLNKVRKRYSIIHYPNGLYWCDYRIDGPITILTDKENEFRFKTFSGDKELGYDTLLPILVNWIKRDYRWARKRVIKIESETLWYKN